MELRQEAAGGGRKSARVAAADLVLLNFSASLSDFNFHRVINNINTISEVD